MTDTLAHLRLPIPRSLNPLVTTHPASSAYRIDSTGVASWTWTRDEVESMAKALVTLDRERSCFYAEQNGGTFRWAEEAGQ